MYFSQKEIFVLCSLYFLIHFFIVFVREDTLYCKFICQKHIVRYLRNISYIQVLLNFEQIKQKNNTKLLSVAVLHTAIIF